MLKTELVGVRLSKEMYDFLLKEANNIEKDISSVIRKFIKQKMETNTLHWIMKFENEEQLADFITDEDYKLLFNELSNLALLRSKEISFFTI